MSVPETSIILYRTDDGQARIEVVYLNEDFWLTQKALAELFAVGVPAVSKHLKNIFDTGELVEDSVVSILETTAADGKNYRTRFYNLDAIIAVGYRVNSYEATQFRIWATKTLKEYGWDISRTALLLVAGAESPSGPVGTTSPMKGEEYRGQTTSVAVTVSISVVPGTPLCSSPRVGEVPRRGDGGFSASNQRKRVPRRGEGGQECGVEFVPERL